MLYAFPNLKDMCNTITCVLGFDFNADIKDIEGNVISTGVKTIAPVENPKKVNMIFSTNWDHFNYELYRKIIDYKKYV
jgi:hypothetical protein